jgi:putative hydrolases of HD superfamily
MDPKKITNYIFELGALKKFHHSGTRLAGVNEPDTIAEHVYRSALIAFVLADMEKADPSKSAMICLLHDNAEARITDLHKVARRYIDSSKSEKAAFRDQTANLPEDTAKVFNKYFQEFEDQSSKEAVIARDADWLETAFQAKEYLDLGYKVCQEWIDNVGRCIKTRSAKKIFKQMKKTNFADWWRHLTKILEY